MGPDEWTGTTGSVELIRQAQAGDGDAMNRLIGRYYERVRPIVRARLGPRLKARMDSADILQETFVEAVRMFDRFEIRAESSLIQWLARIAELRVREAVQKMQADKRNPDREIPIDAPKGESATLREPSAQSPTPSSIAASSEEAERVEACLAQLNPEHREAILLRVYAGASWQEVADALGRPSPGAARMLHSRAMAELSSAFLHTGR